MSNGTRRPLNKATINTLRSVRFNCRKVEWAYLGKFDIVHVRRLEKRGLVETDICHTGPEHPDFRWHVKPTPAGLAFLAA